MFTLSLNLGVIYLELILLFTGLFLFLVDRFISKKGYAFWLSLFVALFLVVLLLVLPFGEFTRAFKTDFYSATLKFLLSTGLIFILVLSYDFLSKFKALNLGEYYGLIFFSVLGVYIMLSSQDFLTLFLGMELMSIPIYFLIASSYVYKKVSIEGAIKYFVVGAIGSLFYILALGIAYYMTGSLYFDALFSKLVQGLYKSEIFIASLTFLFLLIAFSIKLSLVPFHMWAPDAYEASPLPITAFLAGIIKFAMLATLIKLLILAFSPLKIDIGKLLIPTALLTILIGSLLAIKQDHIVRLLAYSSIAHVGYATLGLVSGDFTGYGFSLFYMFVYLFMTIGSFALLIYLAKIKESMLLIPQLSGLAQQLPLVSFFILLIFFSLAGIPPTAGFMAKFYLFVVLVKSKYLWVAIFALIFSILGAYPYLRVIKVIYMDSPVVKVSKAPYSMFFLIPTIVSLLIILFLGIYPSPMVNFISRSLNLYISLHFFHF